MTKESENLTSRGSLPGLFLEGARNGSRGRGGRFGVGWGWSREIHGVSMVGDGKGL